MVTAELNGIPETTDYSMASNAVAVFPTLAHLSITKYCIIQTQVSQKYDVPNQNCLPTLLPDAELFTPTRRFSGNHQIPFQPIRALLEAWRTDESVNVLCPLGAYEKAFWWLLDLSQFVCN